MKRRVITLVDLSENFEHVLKFCSDFALATDAALHLIYQIPGLMPAMTDGSSRQSILDAEKNDAQIRLQSLTRRTVATIVERKIHITEKNIGLFLKENMHPDTTDLVVLGMKKTTFLKKWLTGTIITRLIEHLNCSLLALPLEMEPFIPNTLLVSVSNKYPLHVDAMMSLTEQLKMAGTDQLIFVSVAQNQKDVAAAEAFIQPLLETFAPVMASRMEIYIESQPLEALKARKEEHPASFMVVQKGSRSLTDQLFREFFIDELVHDGQIPVIILP